MNCTNELHEGVARQNCMKQSLKKSFAKKKKSFKRKIKKTFREN